ncbi:MAG: hypothetical protein K2O32_00425 [Acetatifactor sp.]|nr:hypothetical protein [Acetatifactor sp.]
MAKVLKSVKEKLICIPLMNNAVTCYNLSKKYKRMDTANFNLFHFMRCHVMRSYTLVRKGEAEERISELLKKVSISFVEGNTFFYSIDCYKTFLKKGMKFDNYSVDYGKVVNSDFSVYFKNNSMETDCFVGQEKKLLNSMKAYLRRVRENKELEEKFSRNFDAMDSLFERPSENMFEALQRILFYNQLLWQCGYVNNGLGRLDMILYDLYEKDISNGVTKEELCQMLKDFMKALHNYFWFKSEALMGDTGQIIVLGGASGNGEYQCNELTYLFIDISKELRLPDPKVLLRCSKKMPLDLLESALRCISTGIGAPLLSNDDVVIPSMLSMGIAASDAFNYVTSACWEPLVAGESIDQNNIEVFNYVVPFLRMFDYEEPAQLNDIDAIIKKYFSYLEQYISELLTPLAELQFEENPLLTLLSETCQERHLDICRGGAKYSNLGLTSIGLGNVVNSLINIEKYVFEEKRLTLKAFDDIRKADYAQSKDFAEQLKSTYPCYGCDDEMVLTLTEKIRTHVSEEFKKYNTFYGGRFKLGLSSPAYILNAKNVAATFDGRKNGEPFHVHISANKGIALTELLLFASHLDYSGNKLNGNVVDFIVAPSTLKDNFDKFLKLIEASIKNGVYQIQMNVVDAKTLLEAKKHPENYSTLVVRVWGFSAYFVELPEQYQDILIKRALESERAA